MYSVPNRMPIVLGRSHRLKQPEERNLLTQSHELASGFVRHQPTCAKTPKVIWTLGLQFTDLFDQTSRDRFHTKRRSQLAILQQRRIDTEQRLIRTKAPC